MTKRLSRRSMLQRTVAAGAATTLPASVFAQAAAAREPYSNLTPAEARTLEAFVDRLIPSDANGPGALEAGAAYYIDRAFDTALALNRADYASGLAAVERLARDTRGASFADLAPSVQDELLTALEHDAAPLQSDVTDYPLTPAGFFALVRQHAIEGTFCDPHYGGNRDFAGWSMLGYPGVRLAVSPADQAMDAATPPSGISAYDLPMFDDPDDAG